MNTPLFSVIIPTYNSQDYVMQAVYSVENQTCKNYECIIVDDGSTDNTKNILKELKETYENLQVYENAENSGPGIARNTGVNHAKGEYILFLDSDDELAGNLLENLSKKIESEKGFDICDFDFCKGNHADVGSQGIRKDMEYLKKPPRIYMQEFLKLHMDA